MVMMMKEKGARHTFLVIFWLFLTPPLVAFPAVFYNIMSQPTVLKAIICCATADIDISVDVWAQGAKQVADSKANWVNQHTVP